MFELANLLLFSVTALVIAITPGPGIFYVAARTVAGGRGEGLASIFGTGIGGLVHVLAGAVGVSAIIMASADAFTVLKVVGAAYLMWLGFKTFREAKLDLNSEGVETTGTIKAFRDGIIVEAFNPKTAAFFLAFLPQFVVPELGNVAFQFVILGLISVSLNTLVDIVVAYMASSVRNGLHQRPSILRRIREVSGLVIGSLGVVLVFARRNA